MISDERLAAIKARNEARMQGSWSALRCEHGWHIGPQPAGACSTFDDSDSSRHEQQEATAQFIAHAPDDITAMLGELLVLRAMIAGLQDDSAAAELAMHYRRALEEIRTEYARSTARIDPNFPAAHTPMIVQAVAQIDIIAADALKG